jgi:hypothetical protein
MDEWMYEQDADYNRILGQTTGLLAQRGDEHAVALLVDVQSMILADTDELIRTESYIEPWTDQLATKSIYRRKAVFDVEEHLVPRFTEEVCKRISAVLSYVADRNGEENVAYIEPRPALPDVDGDWRATFTARLALERPSNQLVGRRDAPTTQLRTD